MAHTSELEKLYNHNKDDLFHYIKKTFYDENSAQDILHDSFLNFFRYYENKDIPDPISCRMILFRIARNLMINHAKSYYQRNVSFVGEDTSGNFASKTPSPEFSILEKIDQLDVKNTIDSLLNMISPEYREALLLRYQQDLKLEEISKILGMSISGVSRLIERAEKALAQEGKKMGFQPGNYI
ncbi:MULTISPECIES: RNA polymerase sigma factor [Leptospira]|uniref:RNA polymerase subunit sigma-70 n=2 Tax=Leptospira santarosai TaxID=28183 RepID=A0AB73MAW2_9LEPT|nr:MULTISPECIES: sigma-70 family RNA polymerase sigma factor [Leptospira]EKR90907.1 sigma-70, region 4 [Leptospira santarosai str. CBC379]EKT87967.2 RNA polymerase sigma70 [Leptospira santarosai serovar Shermani str. LT 821]KXZ27914.1 RNA polymerase subunit sigma-70 [Leptospira santarosai]MDI7155083.1 sigma-70 family RNA polymerase sigma factor [Leptospira santarosai]MDI7164857.1 sigma-70 family RNA polymerase sigma factor [Leptospira santarosai]